MINKFTIFWRGLFILTLGVAIYFLSFLIKEWFDYSKLRVQVPVKIEEWQVRELKNGKFAIAAKYSYEFQGKNLQGFTLFKKPLYLNDQAAIYDLRKNEAVKSVWLNPKLPQESSLKREFPLYPMIRALLVFTVLGYFFYLKKYIISRNLLNN